MASKQFKKMMAQKMTSYRRPHSHFIDIDKKHPPSTKKGAQEWFIAKRDKKKLPPPPGRNAKKKPEYRDMPMSKFLKKYPEWKP